MITKIDAELLIYIIMCLSVRTYALRHIMSRYASQLIIEKEKEKNLIDLGLEPESSDLAGQPTTTAMLSIFDFFKGIANQICYCFFGIVFCF